MWEGLPRGARFFAAFFPPDFTSRWAEIAEGIVESLWMTVISTVIGIALSMPIGIGAAKNIAPAPVYYFCRGILAVSRSFQEVILAIFFVKLFGFGPFAGVVTLSFATIGFYGKLLAEDIEDMDPAQAEAVRATGAGWLQWINYGVQPQVMPRMIGLGLYRFDINFRESAVVGIVGGGGIGATLNTAFDRYEFDSAAAILLIIIAIVMVVRILAPATCGAGCSDGGRGPRRNENLAAPRARRAVRRSGRPGSSASRSSSIAGSSSPKRRSGRSSPTRRRRPPISACAWCRRTGASSTRCGGRSGTPSISPRSAR